jgi:hypothetical protein
LRSNRTLAASVLAGGIAYRLFLWVLPFGLIVGGALGLMDADGSESAAADGGLPAAIVNAIGDIARAADSSSWWLLLTGVPLLLWEGYTGARALQLIHLLIWHDAPPPIEAAVAAGLPDAALTIADRTAILLVLDEPPAGPLSRLRTGVRGHRR